MSLYSTSTTSSCDSDDDDHNTTIINYPNMANFKKYFRGKGQVWELVLWRNPRVSASIMLGVSVIWCLFEIYDYNFVSLVSRLSMFAMLIIYVTYTMAKYTQWDVPDFEEMTIPESSFKWLYRKTNQLLLHLYYTATGQDLVRFFTTVTLLWMISAIGNHFSSLNLIYLWFMWMGSIPALYERYEKQVDNAVIKGMKVVTNLFHQFLTNIPSKQIH